MKGNLILMIGFQGSGKTTLSKKLAKKYGWIRIGTDDLKEMIGEIPNKNVIRKEIEIISTIFNLKNGRTVILDKMALNKKTRENIIKLYRDFANKIIAVVLLTPLNKCFINNLKRENVVSYKSYASRLSDLDPVDKKEGFDEIVYVNGK